MAPFSGSSAIRCLCLLGLCSSIWASQRHALFRRYHGMNDFKELTHRSATTAWNRKHCSDVCLADSSCFSFTFDGETKTCFLYDRLVSRREMYRSDAATYYKTWSNCPSGWVVLNGTSCVMLSSDQLTWTDASQR